MVCTITASCNRIYPNNVYAYINKIIIIINIKQITPTINKFLKKFTNLLDVVCFNKIIILLKIFEVVCCNKIIGVCAEYKNCLINL